MLTHVTIAQLLTSATTLGALIAGFSSGVLVRFPLRWLFNRRLTRLIQADIIGRKIVIGLADAIFIIGAGSLPPRPPPAR